MGKRLPRKLLVAEIAQRREELDECLASVPRSRMNEAGVTRGGWSVKDILAHLAEWQAMNLRWNAEARRGRTPSVPAAGYTWRELPRLNAAIYRKHHRRALRDVLADYRRNHARMLALIDGLSDADLITPGRFEWTGPSWTLSDFIRANTSAHYHWATKRIRSWLRSQRAVSWAGTPKEGGQECEPRRSSATYRCSRSPGSSS